MVSLDTSESDEASEVDEGEESLPTLYLCDPGASRHILQAKYVDGYFGEKPSDINNFTLDEYELD